MDRSCWNCGKNHDVRDDVEAIAHCEREWKRKSAARDAAKSKVRADKAEARVKELEARAVAVANLAEQTKGASADAPNKRDQIS